MNIKEITSGIFYVGVNDRRTRRFEGLWPLPYGVSYNSYLIKGSEKNALVDTVELSSAEAFIQHIKNTLGEDAGLDYLVINHMEPDHSGAIPTILRAFPGIKIVCNKITASMIGGFYHITAPEHFLVIADGDTLSLGDKTLSFHLTPMVHWPETMMTYVAEDKVLFTGDAFGTFGALCGAVIDSEMDTEVYIREMYRYYSNIVGKYGRFVQRALTKVAPLDIVTICPTHGPVWRDEIARVHDIYNRLSRYESEKGTVIVYGSMYGNTAEAAEAIAAGLAAAGEKKIIMHDATSSDLSYMISDCFRYKKLVFASPTYSMSIFPPVEALLKALLVRETSDKTVGLVGSFTWAPAAMAGMSDYCKQMKLDVVGTVELKQSMNEETRIQIEALVDALKD